MSGPILDPAGTLDGVSWVLRPDLGSAAMIAPAAAHGSALTPPAYWTGPVPYYGDWQITPNGATLELRLVFEFSKAIKQVRTTAQFVGTGGLAMYAVRAETDFSGIGGLVFIASASATWDISTSGSRTVTDEVGFKFLVIKSVFSTADNARLITGPTFRNTFFFETLPVASPTVGLVPSVRVPHGAGRLLSLTGPIATIVAATDVTGVYIRPEGGSGAIGHAELAQTTVGVPPLPIGNALYRGANSRRISAGNGTGGIIASQSGLNPHMWQLYPAIERMLKANLDGLDEVACFRVAAVLAVTGVVGPITYDCGLTISAGQNTQIRGSTHPGVSFGVVDQDTPKVSIRQTEGGPIVEHDIDIPPGYDPAELNVYDIRVLSATSKADAMMRFFLNDSEVYRALWGAGTELPIPMLAPDYGMRWAIINLGGSAGFTTTLYLPHGGFTYAVAMAEDALL